MLSLESDVHEVNAPLDAGPKGAIKELTTSTVDSSLEGKLCSMRQIKRRISDYNGPTAEGGCDEGDAFDG